ncbi:hypothetical protein [Nostoc flagelliforme]|uniref:hypothetical protein n=1 Tax=Nostoc flagelliforme TaxID=1306274 RepID=UPI001A7EC565|nr:hypothetical protein [Nostoc flagelliforme]
MSKVIEFLELDAQQLEETDPYLEEVNKTLKVLNRYKDELNETQIRESHLLQNSNFDTSVENS